MVRIRYTKSRHNKLKVESGKWKALVLFFLTLSACSSTPGNKKYDPGKVNFTATVNPLFDGQVYPSLLLGLNQANAPELNEQLAPFAITVTAPVPNTLLRVVVDSTIFNYVTTFEEILPKRGETYTFLPRVNWKYDLLSGLRQSRPLDLTFTCYINDEQVMTKNLHFTLRTVNECPLSFRHGNQRNPRFQPHERHRRDRGPEHRTSPPNCLVWRRKPTSHHCQHAHRKPPAGS